MRLARSFRWALRTLLGAVVLLYFLLALAVLGLRYGLLPEINTYRDDIAREISQVVGLPVQLGEVQVRWTGRNPQLTLSDVQVLDDENQPLLSFAQVGAVVSWRSLFTWQPEFRRLRIDEPRLYVTRTADGHLTLAGQALGASTELSEGSASFRWMLRQPDIQVRRAELHWRDIQGDGMDHVFPDVDIDWRHSVWGASRLSVRAGASPLAASVEILGEFQQPLQARVDHHSDDFATWDGQMFVAVQDADLDTLSRLLDVDALPASGRIAGRAWLDLDDGQWTQARAQFAADGVQVADAAAGRSVALQGLRGELTGDWPLRRLGGKLTLAEGALAWPGLFDPEALPLADVRLAGQAVRDDSGAWQSIELQELAFTAGEPGTQATLDAQGGWQAGPTPAGTLTLAGTLPRADAAAVGRLLPVAVGEDVHLWLSHAFLTGEVRDGTFRVAGPLEDFPFGGTTPTGEFTVAANLHDLALDIDPHASLAWPRFEEISGTLRIDRDYLEAQLPRGRIGAEVITQDVQVEVRSLTHDAQLQVKGVAHGPAQALIDVVNADMLGDVTGQALADAQGTGDWRVPITVQVPLLHTDQAKVQGQVLPNGGSFAIVPEVPPMTALEGAIGFSDQGVTVAGLKGQLLGGAAELNGGVDAQGEVDFTLTGQATAQGLRERWPQPGLARVQGQFGYTLQVTAKDDDFAVQLRSPLTGLALDVPAPLTKPAARAWPLQLDWRQNVGAQRTLAVDATLGDNATVQLRQSGPLDDWNSLRLAVGINRDATLPETPGLRIKVHAAEIDLDHWYLVMDKLMPEDSHSGTDGLPLAFHLTAGQVWLLGGVGVNDLTLAASQAGDEPWRIELDGQQLQGMMRWTEGKGDAVPSVVAHFSRLDLDLSAGEHQIPEPALAEAASDPLIQPDVDLVVDALRWEGVGLGRAVFKANNDADNRRWHLRQLSLEGPALALQGEGEWGMREPSADGLRRRMQMNLQGEVRDAGVLLGLARLPDVLSGGQGSFNAQLGWFGRPLSPQLNSLDGDITLDLADGRFLQASSTAGRLLGVLSLQSLARTATFSSGSLFESGFAWNQMAMEMQLDDGVARIAKFHMNGPSAVVDLSGTVDLVRETQQLKAVIVPNLDMSAAALLAGVAVNPVVGVGAMLGQWLLRKPLEHALSFEYLVSGTWSDPVVERR